MSEKWVDFLSIAARANLGGHVAAVAFFAVVIVSELALIVRLVEP